MVKWVILIPYLKVFLQGPKARTLNAILSAMKLQLVSHDHEESEYEFSS